MWVFPEEADVEVPLSDALEIGRQRYVLKHDQVYSILALSGSGDELIEQHLCPTQQWDALVPLAYPSDSRLMACAFCLIRPD